MDWLPIMRITSDQYSTASEATGYCASTNYALQLTNGLAANYENHIGSV